MHAEGESLCQDCGHGEHPDKECANAYCLCRQKPRRSKSKGASIKGTLRVGMGKENELFHMHAIAPYGDTNKVDVVISADGRNVVLSMDKESAVKLARRILDELGEK